MGKYIPDLETAKVVELLNTFRMEFGYIVEVGYGYEVCFKDGKNDIKFDMCLDRDTASYRHVLDWQEAGDGRTFNYQTTRWTMSADQDNVLKILKRRLKEYVRDHPQ